MGAHRRLESLIAVGLVAGCCALALADRPGASPSPAERGRSALTARGFLKPGWKDQAYRNAGKLWGPGSPDPDKEPEAYAAAFGRRYGMNSPPFPNDGLPMGLRRGVKADGTLAGITVDCLMCHGGSIGGKSVIGLGNTQLDTTLLFEEMTRADGRKMPFITFVVNTARGTVNAGMFTSTLLSLRNSDLSFRTFPLPLGVNLAELDVPAWWLLGRKRTMYYDGSTPAESSRASMQFLLGEKSLEDLKALEPAFEDIRAFFVSLKPPRYPFAVDAAKAERGAAVFEATCAKCHGTYGPDGEYPNRIVPLKEIGTDPGRAIGLSDKLVAHYNSTWLAEGYPASHTVRGYQAPPLDGIWATAPYLHNGSVPTLYNLLKSSTRPSRFKRPPSTDFSHYDRSRVGWSFETVDSPRSLGPEDRRFLYDTSRFGLGNGGHTFGDKLPEVDRLDLIEYLKTL
jgi:mono/diheme cytochrome c family protein